MNTLAECTNLRLRRRFDGWSHQPDANQWAALADLAVFGQKMADKVAPPVFALCDLDPGLGKSQTVGAFTRCLLDDRRYDHVGTLVMVSRLEEIDRYVSSIGLQPHEFAALASETTVEGQHCRELGLGADRTDEAKVLFITQQRLALVSEHGRQFSNVRQFYFQGRPRDCRWWDESLMPALGLRLDRYQIASLADGFKSNGLRDAADWCLYLTQSLKVVQDNTILDLDMPRKEELELADMRRIFKGNRVDIAETLLLLADQERGLVRHENKGNALISFTEALPADLAPCCILDASGRVRSTYEQWATYRKTLVRLTGAKKDYSNLTIWRWNRSTSQSAWAKWPQGPDTTHPRKVTIDELVGGIAEIIGTRPEHEPFLIVTHKPKPKLVDAEALIRRAVGDRPGALYFLHYGRHTATNDYVDVPNVIIAGTLIYETAQYEADGRGASGTSIEHDYAEDLRRQVRLGEHAHHFFQAICRCAVRKSVGSSCGTARCWIIGAQKDGFSKENIEQTFPEAKVFTYRETFLERIIPAGKAGVALAFVLKGLSVATEVARPDTEEHVKLSKGNYRRLVTLDKAFISALEREGIEEILSETTRAPNGRRVMVYRYADPSKRAKLAA
jgi:hypothetical protein